LENKYTYKEIDLLISYLYDFNKDTNDAGAESYHTSDTYNKAWKNYEKRIKIEIKKSIKIKSSTNYLKYRLNGKFYKDWAFVDDFIIVIFLFIFKVKYEDIPLYFHEVSLRPFIKWRLKLGK
jgi:hypothetical protein